MIVSDTSALKGSPPLRVCILQGEPEDWLNLRIPYGSDGSILQASMRGREADMPLARCRLKRMW
jgi:hypothetical protein